MSQQTVLARAAVLGDGRAITGADIRAALPVAKREEASVEERVIALIGSAGEVAVRQVMVALRVPRTTAWRALVGLVEQKKIEAVGETKGRRYRVAVVPPLPAPGPPMDPPWQPVLDIAAREGLVRRRRVVAVLGVSESTAGRLLAEMAEAGRLAQKGEGRALGYVAAGTSRMPSPSAREDGMAQNTRLAWAG